MYKQRSTKHTYKTKYRLTRTPLKTESELGYSGRVGSFCLASDTRRVNLVTNPIRGDIILPSDHSLKYSNSKLHIKKNRLHNT